MSVANRSVSLNQCRDYRNVRAASLRYVAIRGCAGVLPLYVSCPPDTPRGKHGPRPRQSHSVGILAAYRLVVHPSGQPNHGLVSDVIGRKDGVQIHQRGSRSQEPCYCGGLLGVQDGAGRVGYP